LSADENEWCRSIDVLQYTGMFLGHYLFCIVSAIYCKSISINYLQ